MALSAILRDTVAQAHLFNALTCKMLSSSLLIMIVEALHQLKCTTCLFNMSQALVYIEIAVVFL